MKHLVCLAALALLACSADETTSGTPLDAAPAVDAATSADAGAPSDATPPADAGERADAGGLWGCENPLGVEPDALRALGCFADFATLASAPLDASIPGARSLKTIIDRVDGDALYFQNTHLYPIHWNYASTHLSGRGLPVVPMLAGFNATEYSSPTRRFLLGTVTYYEGPGIYCYEVAPYDTADAEMITTAFRAIRDHSYFGDRLSLHLNSEAVGRVARELPPDVPTITTDALYAGIDYQPLNVAESYGRLRFVTADALQDAYVSFREIPVLDRVPNDIAVTAGIITEQFQTPLSHINVLAKNRRTPNMALRGAFDHPRLRALEGQWVRLSVGALDYEIEAVEQAEADAWWEANKPDAVRLPGVDLSVRDLRDIADTIDPEALPLLDAIKAGTRAFGGKAAHFGALARVEGVPSPKAFAVPVSFYFDFMAEHGFDAQVLALLDDPAFLDDPAVRDARLADLRAAIEAAPLDADFLDRLTAKLEAEYPDTRMRFRSSTNAEDLDGFTGAGLYTSKSGQVGSRDDPIEKAVRRVWASVWSLRAFEERSYRSIDHLGVGMALLVHRSFPDEEANGVALTNNPFDPTGLEPAFYVNVQAGEASVVSPAPGVTADAFLYYFDRADQPISFISRSSEVPAGQTVLDAAQTFALGQALARIRDHFTEAYGPGADDAWTWWAMDVEFKFDGAPGEVPALFIKQARPYR